MTLKKGCDLWKIQLDIIYSERKCVGRIVLSNFCGYGCCVDYGRSSVGLFGLTNGFFRCSLSKSWLRKRERETILDSNLRSAGATRTNARIALQVGNHPVWIFVFTHSRALTCIHHRQILQLNLDLHIFTSHVKSSSQFLILLYIQKNF